jgi:type IV pilus assembly protein PilV
MAIYRPSKHQLKSRRTARGFTLIEILVSFVVFAFGMLGAAGLQLVSLKANQQAANHAVVSQAVREISDIMLVTPDYLASTHAGSTATAAEVEVDGNIRTINRGNPFFEVDFKTTDAVDTGGTSASACFTAACIDSNDPAKFLRAHIADWVERSREALPGVQVRICQDSDPIDENGIYRWKCSNTGAVTAIKLSWATRQKADLNQEQSLSSQTADGDEAGVTRPPTVVVQLPGTQQDSYTGRDSTLSKKNVQ